jgi:hypothetical protein
MSSVYDITPVKDGRGRPAYTPETRQLSSMIRGLATNQDTPRREAYEKATADLERKKEASRLAAAEVSAAETAAARARAAEESAQIAASAKKALDAQNTVKAQQVLTDLTKSTAEGGYNFKDLDEFFQGGFRMGGDQHISANITRFVHSHGANLARSMFARSAPAKDEYISGELAEIYQREGRAIQKLLTRDSTMTVMDLLKVFSMDKLAVELEAAAPYLWEALVAVSAPDSSTRRESDGEARRDKGLVRRPVQKSCLSSLTLIGQVFTTICALISVMRSQKANNFQVVIGLFLLGSGASKREMEVLAHAGLSISYTSIITHVKGLSAEGMVRIRELVKTSMVQIVWDNLNIAFRVAAQRLKAKNHFDNGTTATVIPLFDPATGGNAVHGTLPFSMKPPRERTLPVLDWTAEDVLPSPQSTEELLSSCFWQLKRLASTIYRA